MNRKTELAKRLYEKASHEQEIFIENYKKICSILMAAFLIFSVPLFSCSAETLSTTVKYESRGTSYYEVNVPLEMVPGETAIVSAVGNWGSQEALNVTADTVVTLLSDEHPDDKIDLTIKFDGIHEFGS